MKEPTINDQVTLLMKALKGQPESTQAQMIEIELSIAELSGYKAGLNVRNIIWEHE